MLDINIFIWGFAFGFLIGLGIRHFFAQKIIKKRKETIKEQDLLLKKALDSMDRIITTINATKASTAFLKTLTEVYYEQFKD